MFSAIVLASDAGSRATASAEAMVRTLASLIPSAVDGLIKDVTLAALEGSDDARNIADHAGCAMAEASTHESVLASGLAAARGQLILVVRAGFVPETGFIEEASDTFGVSEKRMPSAALLRQAPDSVLTRFFPAASPIAGMIFHRMGLNGEVTDLFDLRRKLRSPITMRCRLRYVA